VHGPSSILEAKCRNFLSAETREATCNAITLSTSDPVTITILPLTRSVSQQYLLNRLKILRQLDHPAFFQFKDCFLVDGNEIREFWIVVERTAGKTLEDILEKRTEPLEENVVAKLAYDVRFIYKRTLLTDQSDFFCNRCSVLSVIFIDIR
jgi:serine/threonine protein kinase